jgi:hypothetical protein
MTRSLNAFGLLSALFDVTNEGSAHITCWLRRIETYALCFTATSFNETTTSLFSHNMNFSLANLITIFDKSTHGFALRVAVCLL